MTKPLKASDGVRTWHTLKISHRDRKKLRSQNRVVSVSLIIAKAIVVIIIDAETRLDHATDSASELSGLTEIEAKSAQGCVEHKLDQILNSLVLLVGGCMLLQLNHGGVFGVDLDSLLGDHV